MKKLLFGAFIVTLIAAAPARAQSEKPVHFNIGGGMTMPVSSEKDHFGIGGGFNAGMIINVNPMFGLQAEYSFNSLSGKDKQIPLFTTPTPQGSNTTTISSHHDMHYIDFNGILKVPGDSKVKPYALGGAGFYYRTVSLTTPDVGFTTICDPWWYVCYPAAVAIDKVIGERHSWDPGMDIGGGVTVALGESAQFYAETRWHYVWGPEFTGADGVAKKANGQYFPVTFGFRF